jgi:tetratricopeptide (TPR) repeat protein
MPDVFEDDDSGIEGQSATDAAALSLALNSAANDKTVAAKAAVFLDEQTKLVRLQAADLRKEDALRHWSLRVRHVNDLLKLTFGLGAAFVVLIVAIALAALVWNAHEATGLLIQPINTPPDFAARGLDGTVLAHRLLDKLNGLVTEADKWSFRAADTVSGNWGNDSKVEIPETGISVFELSRFLRQSLGRETSMSGELYRTPTGIALTVRVGAGIGTTFEGREQDVDALLSRAAQSLLAQTQPYRYVYMLYAGGRPASGIVPIARQFAEAASGSEQSWLRTAWEEQLEFAGQYREAADVTAATIASAPDNPFGYFDMGPAQWALGHLEQAYDNMKVSQKLLGGGSARDFEPAAIPFLRANADSFAADLIGAYGDAIAADIAESKTGLFDLNVSGPGALANDYAHNHDPASARATLARAHLASDDILIQPEYVTTTGPDLPNFFVRADIDDWVGARDTLARTDQAALGRGDIDDVRHTLIWPWLAYAWAKTGRLGDAEALIAKTPRDCTLCLEMRGRIDEAKGDAVGAAYWFGEAIRDAPALPFSETDWGNMLLRRRDIDGAILKYQNANRKSPHFADPLEMWGEALMLKNRSDLALAKFEEANKYAPNWGRLHLKWGEALMYVGRRDEAHAQFATASVRDLSAADKVELAAVRHLDG